MNDVSCFWKKKDISKIAIERFFCSECRNLHCSVFQSDGLIKTSKESFIWFSMNTSFSIHQIKYQEYKRLSNLFSIYVQNFQKRSCSKRKTFFQSAKDPLKLFWLFFSIVYLFLFY